MYLLEGDHRSRSIFRMAKAEPKSTGKAALTGSLLFDEYWGSICVNGHTELILGI